MIRLGGEELSGRGDCGLSRRLCGIWRKSCARAGIAGRGRTGVSLKKPSALRPITTGRSAHGWRMIGHENGVPPTLDLRADKLWRIALRENPHHRPPLWRARVGNRRRGTIAREGAVPTTIWVDLDAAWALAQEFEHTRQRHHQAHQSLRMRRAEQVRLRAIAKPSSAIRCRRTAACWLSIGRSMKKPPREVAKTLSKPIAAPDYTAEALAVLGREKEPAALEGGAFRRWAGLKSISGGFLAQTADVHRLARKMRTLKTKRAPTDEEGSRWSLRGRWPSKRQVKRHCLCARRPNGWRRRRQMSPGGLGQNRPAKAVLPWQERCRSDAFFPFRMAWRRRRSTV